MAVPRERILHVCILNITANPHPEGIYVQLLRRAADFVVNARASDYAKITVLRRDARVGRYYTGRILVWTEIDLQVRWLDLARGEELTERERAAIRIPPK